MTEKMKKKQNKDDKNTIIYIVLFVLVFIIALSKNLFVDKSKNDTKENVYQEENGFIISDDNCLLS